MSRYARQEVLPEVGLEGQQRLSKAHAVVVGAGGLGCPALQYLAGAGVGQITIVDPDSVDETNLHRQPLYATAETGQRKAEVARAAIERLNPHLQIVARPEALTPRNAPADRKSTRLNSSHSQQSRMPSSA